MLNQHIANECTRLGIPQNIVGTREPEFYSQAGEDLIVETLLAAVVTKKPIRNMFYLEIGANHPIQASNTYLFYKHRGAQGVLFEADPELILTLEKARPKD